MYEIDKERQAQGLDPYTGNRALPPADEAFRRFMNQAPKQEKDPSGKAAHTPGAKLDAGKVRPALVLGGFARALLAVSRIGTFGAGKYTENGWVEVSMGEARYDDAKVRHWLFEHAGVECDPESEELHAAHEAWNALARLDLILRRKEQEAMKRVDAMRQEASGLTRG